MIYLKRESVVVLLLLAGCGRYPIPTQVAPRALSAPYQYYFPVAGCSSCAVRPTPVPTPLPPIRPPLYGVVDLDGRCDTLQVIGAKWAYNYSTNPLVCSGIESVPMIQSGAQISNTLTGNSKYVMGFNEPDISGWAHQTPDEAAANWRLIEEKYPDRLLVSPAPISGITYDALGWLGRFYQSYVSLYGRVPRLDVLAVHIYFTQASSAETVVQEALNQAVAWNVPEVWVTEWGLALGDSGGQQKAFQDWLTTSGVSRYSWFGSRIDVQTGIAQGWYGSNWVDMSLLDWATHLPTGFYNVYINYSN